MSRNIKIETFSKPGQTVNMIKPETEQLSLLELLEYLKGNKEMVDELLLKSGAILFRGFQIGDRDAFMKLKAACVGNSSFEYVDGSSPRTKLSKEVYTSTEYPKEYRIPMHSELSYSNRWPRTLFFFCDTPSEEGGETPIVDCRQILKALDADLVEPFENHGVKYTRYLRGEKGVGKSWMDTFETQDKSVVEKYCQENNIEYFWENDFIFIGQQGKGVETHPITHEKVWFNQANQFHPAGLPDDIYKGLKMLHAKKPHRFPQNAFFGNGDEIPEKYIKDITEIHFEYAFKFKWEKGDVLMLDNMLMAHGRMPFKGERKIYVSMS